MKVFRKTILCSCNYISKTGLCVYHYLINALLRTSMDHIRCTTWFAGIVCVCFWLSFLPHAKTNAKVDEVLDHSSPFVNIVKNSNVTETYTQVLWPAMDPNSNRENHFILLPPDPRVVSVSTVPQTDTNPAHNVTSSTSHFYTQEQISKFKFVTCVRTHQNDKYIGEFLEYYYHLGMTKLYLILDVSDALSTKNTYSIAAPYVKSGFVHTIDGGSGFQATNKALKQCYNALKSMKNTWYLAIDDDEYLVPVQDEMTIQAAFLRMPSNLTCFQPPRLNFGTYANTSVFPPTVINMHRWRGATPNWLLKSIFLIEATNGTQHGSMDHGQEKKYCNELGPSLSAARPPRAQDPAPLYMNHYLTTTNALRSPIQGQNYNRVKDRNEFYDDSMQRFVTAIQQNNH